MPTPLYDQRGSQMFNQKEYQKKWYAVPENRESHYRAVRKSEKERVKRIKKWVDDYKTTRGCKNCGYKEQSCALDFDHRDGEVKLFNVAAAIHRGSIKRVQEEVAKCDVLCANCHRIRHFGAMV